MNMADVFSGDAFSITSLTAAINRVPFVPGRISSLGLFEEQGVPTTTVSIEEVDGTIALVPVSPRGSPGTRLTRDKRKERVLRIPHLKVEDSVFADEVQNVREFGTSDQLRAVATLRDQRLAKAARSLDATLEYHRIGALKGLVLDADAATVLFNLFTEFGRAQTTIALGLATAATKVRKKVLEIKDKTEELLGGQPYTAIRAVCGKTLFQDLISHADVEKAYERFQEGVALRDDPRYRGFEFAEVIFEQYRGKVGAVPFIADNEGYAYPVGVPGLFITRFGPADYVETVNTIGLPRYAKAKLGEFERSIDIETQSNPINLCTRPEVLIKLTL